MKFGKFMMGFAVTALFSGVAMADNVLLTETQTVTSLPECGGIATLKRVSGDLHISVRGATCANIGVEGQRSAKLNGADNDRSGTIAVDEETGYNSFNVVIESNSGKTADRIMVRTFKAPRNSTYVSPMKTIASLGECEGTVELKIAGNQANLIFKDVKNCSNFDILAANGDATEYTSKKIGTQENRDGSFTLPRALYDRGMNSVQVLVKSNSGKTSQKITVYFLAL